MMSISQVFPLPFIRMGLVKFLKFLVLTCAYKSRQDFTEVLKCSISLYSCYSIGICINKDVLCAAFALGDITDTIWRNLMSVL